MRRNDRIIDYIGLKKKCCLVEKRLLFYKTSHFLLKLKSLFQWDLSRKYIKGIYECISWKSFVKLSHKKLNWNSLEIQERKRKEIIFLLSSQLKFICPKEKTLLSNKRNSSLTERSAVAKSMKQSSDSSPARRTDTDFSPLSSSETKEKLFSRIKRDFKRKALSCYGVWFIFIFTP